MSREALSRDGHDASIHRHAAEVARARGDLAQTEAHLARARALNPYSVR